MTGVPKFLLPLKETVTTFLVAVPGLEFFVRTTEENRTRELVV
jgi:hypothetical protein